MKTHAMELRQRIVAAIDAKEGSQREIARRFGVSGSFIVRLLQHRRKTGGLEPSPHGGGRSFSLDAYTRPRLAAMVRKRPDATLQQLKDFGGFDCTLTTLWRTLRRMGLTRKKKTLRASNATAPTSRPNSPDTDARCGRSSPNGLFSWTRPASPRR